MSRLQTLTWGTAEFTVTLGKVRFFWIQHALCGSAFVINAEPNVLGGFSGLSCRKTAGMHMVYLIYFTIRLCWSMCITAPAPSLQYSIGCAISLYSIVERLGH